MSQTGRWQSAVADPGVRDGTRDMFAAPRKEVIQ